MEDKIEDYIEDIPIEYIEKLKNCTFIEIPLIEQDDKINILDFGELFFIQINIEKFNLKNTQNLLKIYTEDGICFEGSVERGENTQWLFSSTNNPDILREYIKIKLNLKKTEIISKEDLIKASLTKIFITEIEEGTFFLKLNRLDEHKLKRIEIKKFKNIENISINIDDINILVGANNSGKSSILQAIHFGISCGQSYNKVTEKRKKDNSTTVTFDELFYRPINDVKMLGHKGVLGRLENGKGIEIIYESRKSNIAEIQIETGRTRGDTIGIKPKNTDELSNILFDYKNSYSYYVTGLAGILSCEEYKSFAIVKEFAVKGSSNNVFRNILYLLSQKKIEWFLFKKELKKIFNEIEIEVDFDELEHKEINVNGIDKFGIKYPIDAFGTSVLQVIQMISYIYFFNPRLVILDEPDAHLHPNNQIKVINSLVYICKMKNIQLIISTHSKYIVDKLIEKANLIWVNDGKLIDFEQKEKGYIKMLSEIGALEKGAMLANKLIKCIIFTEDSKIDNLKILLESSGFNLIETDIWQYEGCSQIEKAIALSDFIKGRFDSIRIIIHRDRDFIPNDIIENITKKLELNKIDCFFTKGTDIESYFISKEHINSLYEDIEISKIDELIIETVSELKKETEVLGVNSRDTFYNSYCKSARMKKPSQGEISQNFYKEYGENPFYNTKGKDMLSRLKNKIKNYRKSNNIVIEKNSEYLYDKKLRKIAVDIWK